MKEINSPKDFEKYFGKLPSKKSNEKRSNNVERNWGSESEDGESMEGMKEGSFMPRDQRDSQRLKAKETMNSLKVEEIFNKENGVVS